MALKTDHSYIIADEIKLTANVDTATVLSTLRLLKSNDDILDGETVIYTTHQEVSEILDFEELNAIRILSEKHPENIYVWGPRTRFRLKMMNRSSVTILRRLSKAPTSTSDELGETKIVRLYRKSEVSQSGNERGPDVRTPDVPLEELKKKVKTAVKELVVISQAFNDEVRKTEEIVLKFKK